MSACSTSADVRCPFTSNPKFQEHTIMRTHQNLSRVDTKANSGVMAMIESIVLAYGVGAIGYLDKEVTSAESSKFGVVPEDGHVAEG
eukprot:CAMPEP_0196132238 /NCGR_PEP_ID=MMETSP0910-20130528/1953_1 /TAXON_ID=49265 /ORGANISM="Thalassiosira rotula, Strain GSO102" /LENGTH=86 /DNA_ID=CAMNT_0041391833 /DNA_START=22 /DNA_END=277 /DNA_ORIENTATION=+